MVWGTATLILVNKPGDHKFPDSEGGWFTHPFGEKEFGPTDEVKKPPWNVAMLGFPKNEAYPLVN